MIVVSQEVPGAWHLLVPSTFSSHLPSTTAGRRDRGVAELQGSPPAGAGGGAFGRAPSAVGHPVQLRLGHLNPRVPRRSPALPARRGVSAALGQEGTNPHGLSSISM